MSRLYASVSQPKLIEAINTLPTFQDWLDTDWMKSPVGLPYRRAKTPKTQRGHEGARRAA